MSQWGSEGSTLQHSDTPYGQLKSSVSWQSQHEYVATDQIETVDQVRHFQKEIRGRRSAKARKRDI